MLVREFARENAQRDYSERSFLQRPNRRSNFGRLNRNVFCSAHSRTPKSTKAFVRAARSQVQKDFARVYLRHRTRARDTYTGNVRKNFGGSRCGAWVENVAANLPRYCTIDFPN